MSGLIDLNPNHLATAKAILAEHVPACEVRAFGSRVTWTAKDYSDLDLAVVGKRPLDWGTIGRLQEAFEESDLPMRVDVLDWHTIAESFRKVIEQDYAVLQDGVGVDDAVSQSEWIDCTLADACNAINYGLTSSASDHPKGPKFLRITDIVSGHIDWNTVPHVVADDATTSKYQLEDGDIVVARTGASTGTSAYVKNPPQAVFASYLVRLKASPEFDARFLAYYLKAPRFKEFIRGVLGDKSAQPNASASTMTAAPLKAPKSKVEQRAIAHVLGTLDDKIELNRRMNETLEAMARALFKSWFVDFDPVRAKQEGRWRRGESLPGLPADLYDLFPNHLVPSELGEIPEGWKVGTVGDAATIVGGTTPSTKVSKFWEGGTHYWATPKDLSSLSAPVLMKTDRKITDAGLQRIGSGLQSPGTVLMSSRAPIGYLAITEVPVAINQGFIAMQPHERIPSLYLLYWSKTSLDEILNYANGSTFLEVSKRNFRGIPLLLPDTPVLNAYNMLASPLHRELVINEDVCGRLESLRDTLLPRLVAGEIRLPNSTT